MTRIFQIFYMDLEIPEASLDGKLATEEQLQSAAGCLLLQCSPQFLLYDCKMIVLFCQMRFLFCFLSSFVSQRLPRTASSLYLPWNQHSLIFMTLIVDHWLETFIWLKHLGKIFVCLCFNFPHHVYIESIFV